MRIAIPIEGDERIDPIASVEAQREGVAESVGAPRAECSALENTDPAIGIDRSTAEDAMIELKQHAGDGNELARGDQTDDARVALDESFEGIEQEKKNILVLLIERRHLIDDLEQERGISDAQEVVGDWEEG